MKSAFALHLPATIVVLAASFSTPCLAQPPMTRITITHVRPDMLTEWIDLQKNEVVPAQKKAGIKTRTVYVSGLFGNSYEYVIVTPMDNFAQFDGTAPAVKALGEAGAARLGEKLRKCTLSSQSYQSIVLADLSTSNEPPEILVSTRVRVAPGKMQDFESLVKTEVTSAFKKAKVPLLVRRRGLGANSNDVTLSAGYAKYAEMDGGSPIVKALGEEGAARVLGKFTGVATLVEQVVRNRVADLSF